MEPIDYLYRYRSWDSGCYYATLDKDKINIAGAWGPWVFCDENKYIEICEVIQPPYPNHYEAEKLMVTVVGAERFDPHAWIAEKHAALLKDRARKNPHTTPPVNSLAPSPSSMSAFESVSLFEGIGTIGRVVLDALTDGASAVGDCVGDICD